MADTAADARGLTTEEAARRLSAYGPNEPVARQRLSALSELLRLFANPLVIILLVGTILKHDPLESLLFAVALGVGLTPEFLPMIASVTLTRGALRMAREQVIVKHLPAIQNFGSIDILCSDKTGTLTAGSMHLESALDPRGRSSSRALVLGYLNSRFETGIRSPLDTAILAHGTATTDDYRKIDPPMSHETRQT